jgi:hypothetical protein
MKPEKKNRIISIFSVIITVICFVIIVLLLVNYLNVKAENEELRSQLEESSQTGILIPERQKAENIVFDYD